MPPASLLRPPPSAFASVQWSPPSCNKVPTEISRYSAVTIAARRGLTPARNLASATGNQPTTLTHIMAHRGQDAGAEGGLVHPISLLAAAEACAFRPAAEAFGLDASPGRAPVVRPVSGMSQDPSGCRPAKAFKPAPVVSFDSLVAEESAILAPLPRSAPPSFGSGGKDQPRRPILGARLPNLGESTAFVPRTFAPEPAIKIVYNLDPIVLDSGMSPPPPRSGPSPPLSAPALAATAEKLRGAAQAVSDQEPVLSHADLVSAAANGKVTSQQSMQHRARLAEMAKLVAVLPIQAIAHVCAVDVASLAGMGSDRLAQHVMTCGRPSRWVPNTIRDVKNTWIRFMAWLDRHGVTHNGMVFDAVSLGSFLTEVDTNARAGASERQARAARADAAARARASARGEPHPPQKRWNDGSSAERGVVSKLKMCVDHFGMTLPLDRARACRMPGSRPSMPTPAVTIGMVFRLYAFVSAAAKRWQSGELLLQSKDQRQAAYAAHAAVAAAMLFAAFSCNRCEQANNCIFTGEVDGYLHGVLLLDKNPNPDKRQARPFWMRIAGFDGETVWFEFLKAVLQPVAAGCFTFRDFAGTGHGDPNMATHFINSPLCGPRLVTAIACVISRVCGVAPDTSQRWAKHSFRHFLMECAAKRGVNPLRAVEIGRWSGSTAQDPDLTSNARIHKEHVIQSGVMPEHYAPLNKIARVCAIVGDEMTALDQYWAKLRLTCVDSTNPVEQVPVFGDFSPLLEWMADSSVA